MEVERPIGPGEGEGVPRGVVKRSLWVGMIDSEKSKVGKLMNVNHNQSQITQQINEELKCEQAQLFYQSTLVHINT